MTIEKLQDQLEVFDKKNPDCPINCNSLLVGKKCIYCMECGQIKLEYKKKEDFKTLMSAFEKIAKSTPKRRTG